MYNIYSIISVAFVLAMRFSIILLLFAFTTLVCGDNVEEADNFTGTIIKIKNGVLQVNITNRIIILNLTKNGESQ